MIIIPQGGSTKPASKRDQAQGLLVMAAVALAIALFVFVQGPRSAARPPTPAGWAMLGLAVLFALIGGISWMRADSEDHNTEHDNNSKEEQ